MDGKERKTKEKMFELYEERHETQEKRRRMEENVRRRVVPSNMKQGREIMNILSFYPTYKDTVEKKVSSANMDTYLVIAPKKRWYT